MRPTLKEFKKKALANPEVEKEYMELSPAYALRKQLIKIRKDAGLTQEELAEILHTKKSNISRLENVNSKISPKLSTIEEYAKAVGYKLEINFVEKSERGQVCS
ncbi:MAG: helix-turn-helix transcriptional regulator [Deltaproteobacteria bacterium]|nr:helix-turn-helix transcriptional regulator [Deltaproteobacteria bacterium]